MLNKCLPRSCHISSQIQDLFRVEYGEVFHVTVPTSRERRTFFEDLLLNQAARAPASKKKAGEDTTVKPVKIAWPNILNLVLWLILFALFILLLLLLCILLPCVYTVTTILSSAPCVGGATCCPSSSPSSTDSGRDSAIGGAGRGHAQGAPSFPAWCDKSLVPR